MKSLLTRIHARVGDLWWYSAMIFVACRSGDVINAFIGLWLVPKYVGPNELGAVLPLQQLTSFLTVPLGVVAIVFAKYVNTYATRGEYGKVKSFIRDVLGISAILFILCIAGAYLVMPYFYERLRVQSGLLTVLILASGFVAALGQLIGSTQQGLKRFKTMSFTAIISAPVRLVTMLVAMPIRALSGYLLGQTTPGVVTTACAAYDTHQALKPYAPDPTWRKDWKQILNYTWPIAIYTAIGIINATISTTVFRQRLPELESAAFYLLSRFAELATYFSSSVIVILFPLAAEMQAKGEDNSKLLRNSMIGVAICTGALILAFALGKDLLIHATETWSVYSDFGHLLPWLTLSSGTGSMVGLFISFEMANKRFSAIAPVQVLNTGFALFLVSFTGYEYFHGILPASVVDFMRWADIAHLDRLVYIGNAWNFLQLIIFYFLTKHNKHKPSKPDRIQIP